MIARVLLFILLLPLCAHAQDRGENVLLEGLKQVDTWEAAHEDLETLWRQEGSDTDRLFVYRAQRAFVQGQVEQALEHATDLVGYNPDYAYGWRVYGQVAITQGDIGSALAGFLQATALESNDYVAWTSLGLILEQLEYWDEALLAYETAYDISPFHERAKQGFDRMTLRADGLSL